jgi:hypothetical protein
MTSSLRLLMVVPAAELVNCIETLGPLIGDSCSSGGDSGVLVLI